MNSSDIKRLALILSVQAEIDGMKLDNKIREQNNQPFSYNEDDFIAKAEELKKLAYIHDDQL
jgi:hypothetical protein